MSGSPTPSTAGPAHGLATNSTAGRPGVDVKEFYAGLPTPVCIVTTYAADRAPHATTVGSYCTVSLTPPIVLFCLLPGSHLLGHLDVGSSLRVHFASADDADLVAAFAVKGGPRKFDGTAWTAEVDAPTLPGLNHLSGNVLEMVDIGDHVVLYVAVTGCTSTNSESAPLLYHRRSFGRFEGNDSWPPPTR
ncbi:MAG: flavin reductase family protein [Mycobacterium sp.]